MRGGEYEHIAGTINATVVESQDASAVGSTIGRVDYYYAYFFTDWAGGVEMESTLLGYSPVRPQCRFFAAPTLIPVDGSEFEMYCDQKDFAQPDAVLRLRFVEDGGEPPIEGIGPAGRLVGEYRNGTEVYAVEIHTLWGSFEACGQSDSCE